MREAASYSADDLMIVERDIGRLAKYTFDMGGTGDLLALSLNVPPWEDLHELSREELRLTNLITADMVAQLGSPNGGRADAQIGTGSLRKHCGGFCRARVAGSPFEGTASPEILKVNNGREAPKYGYSPSRAEADEQEFACSQQSLFKYLNRAGAAARLVR